MPKTREALLREIKDLRMEGDSILVDLSVLPRPLPPTLLFESVEQETEAVYLFHGRYRPSHLRDSALIRLLGAISEAPSRACLVTVAPSSFQ